jgi:hypothetical protein
MITSLSCVALHSTKGAGKKRQSQLAYKKANKNTPPKFLFLGAGAEAACFSLYYLFA